MTKRKLLPVASFLLAAAAVAGLAGCPRPAVTWVTSIGHTDGDDAAYAVADCADGGFIVAGHREPAHVEDHDGAVVKLASDGTVEWETLFDDGADDVATAVAQAPDGGYLAGGRAIDAEGEEQVWVMRLDADGSEVWSSYITDGGLNELRSLEAHADGSFVVALQRDLLGASEVVVEEYDADGGLVWSKVLAQGAHMGHATVMPDGGVAVAWWTIVPGETFLESTGEVGIEHLDTDGGTLWSVNLERDTPFAVAGLAPTADRGFVVAGQSGLFSNDASALLIKVEGTGEAVWETALGGAARDVLHDVIALADGRFAAVGEYGVDAGHPHMYLALVDTAGRQVWERAYGEDDEDIAYEVVQAEDGGFVLVGLSGAVREADGTRHHDMVIVRTDAEGHCPGFETELASE